MNPLDRLHRNRAIAANLDPEKVEVARILSLPVELDMSPEDVEIFSMTRMLGPAFEAGHRLRPRQVLAVDAYERLGGGFIPLGVGQGKTGISLMIAHHAYQKGVRKSLLLVPASLIEQLVKRDIPFWRKMVPLNVPFHVLAGRTKAYRERLAKSDAPGCYIMPYSLMSQLDAVPTLDAIRPGLIIADEVHQAKNKRAAVGKRLHALLEQEPSPEFVCMSGTISKKHIADFHHLITCALKSNSPLPATANMAYLWGQVLDSTAEITADQRTAQVLKPIVDWARELKPDEQFSLRNTETYRRAFAYRLHSAPGVTASTEADALDAALNIYNEPLDEAKPDDETYIALQGHLDRLDETSETPNGDLLVHAMLSWKWYYELHSGFYNRLYWPSPEWMMKHRNVSELEANDLLKRAKIHHAYSQEYDKVLRDFFKSAPLGLDTPREVGLAIHRGDKRVWREVVSAYQLMKDHDFPGRPERLTEAVRVYPGKIHKALDWCRTLGKGGRSQGGLIWVWNIEMGRWVAEALKDAGVDVFYAPAGANDEITDSANADRVCVASIRAHSTGKNLQFWNQQLVLQWPRDAAVAEQMLGRTHRQGQLADEVSVTTCNTAEFEHAVMGACLHDSIYVQQTLSLPMKMLMASYSPLPQIFSPEFLRERGMQVHDLSFEQQERLRETFGDFTI